MVFYPPKAVLGVAAPPPPITPYLIPSVVLIVKEWGWVWYGNSAWTLCIFACWYETPLTQLPPWSIPLNSEHQVPEAHIGCSHSRFKKGIDLISRTMGMECYWTRSFIACRWNNHTGVEDISQIEYFWFLILLWWYTKTHALASVLSGSGQIVCCVYTHFRIKLWFWPSWTTGNKCVGFKYNF